MTISRPMDGLTNSKIGSITVFLIVVLGRGQTSDGLREKKLFYFAEPTSLVVCEMIAR